MSAVSSKFFGRAVVVLIGLLLLVRLIGMAAVPLMDTTEARYGEIGRKMAELNDWVTPWFDYGVPYWGKPPLAFWVTAISFKLFGVNEFDARLPHLISSLLIVALAAWLAGRRDRDAALPTVALISGSFLYFISAGAVMTDIELILGTTLAMAGFWLAVGQPADDRTTSRFSRWGSGAMFFGGLILGLLSKGPVALVLAGAPLFLWTLYNNRWLEVWRRLPWVSGTLLTLLISLPWYWAAEHRTPGFLEYFLVGEHWRRFMTPGWNGDRYGNAHVFPIGSIWVFALIDSLPWSLLLPLAIWRWRATPAAVPAAGVRSDERVWQGYLLAWALAPLLIFTAARNIIMTYVLPGLPAATILAGGWLARQQRQGHEVNRWLSAGLLLTLLIMCGLAIADLSQPDKMARRSAKALLAAYDHATAAGAGADTTAAGPAPATPLIFIWSRPFSSEFYSHGHAAKVVNDDEAWRSIGPRAAFVVTRWPDTFIGDHSEAAIGAGSTARAVTRIGHYGDFDLLSVAAR